MSLIEMPPEIIVNLADYILWMDENAPREIGRPCRVHAILNVVLHPVMERAKKIPFLVIIREAPYISDLRKSYYGFGKFWAKSGLRDG
jgi:hypothetical protein